MQLFRSARAHRSLVLQSAAFVCALSFPPAGSAENPQTSNTSSRSLTEQVLAIRIKVLPLRPEVPQPPAAAAASVGAAETSQLRLRAPQLSLPQILPPQEPSRSAATAGISVPDVAATEQRIDIPHSDAQPVPSKAIVAGLNSGNPEPIKARYDVRLIGQRDVGGGVNFYSLDREVAVGRDLSKQVESTSKLITDPVVTEYVNRIGQNLVRNSDARVPFTIKVIDNEEVNAFALPGGFFYVDTGLILAADNEAELAAVMAHEIAHVAARHATKNMTKSQIWNMASIPLMFIGGPAGYAIAEIASIAVPLSFLKFSRDAEREADMLGLQYDYAAGYDPQAFVQFFEKLNADEKKKHSKLAKMFSTHPMSGDRVTAAQNEIRQYLPDRDSYIVDTSDFDQVKARLMAQENTHHLGTMDNRRPVLLKRTGSSTDADTPADSSSTPQGSNGSSSGQSKDDSDRPTLKRNPQQ